MKFKAYYKANGIPFELIFVIIGLVFGLLIIFVNPPFYTADESTHFHKSYLVSRLEFLVRNNQKIWAADFPKSIVECRQRAMINWDRGDKYSHSRFKAARNRPLKPQETLFTKVPIPSISPIPYIPFSIGIAIGIFINDNPYWLVWFGRLAGLFTFLALMYIVIRSVPFGKGIFFLYGLTPIVLYQGASVTYDMLNNAMSFILLAVFLKYAFDPNFKLTGKKLALIFALILIHRFSKGGYPLIPFLFFLIPMQKIGKPWKAVLIGLCILLCWFIPDYTWGLLIGAQGYQVLAIGQKDVYFNSGMNIAFIFSHPLDFLSILLRNIWWQAAMWTRGTMGRFGHAYLNLPDWFYILHGLVLIFTAFFEPVYEYVLSRSLRWLLFGIGLGTVAVVIVGDFVTGSAVGGTVIFGLQGRYFVPAVPVLLFLLCSKEYYNRRWQQNRWIALSAWSIFTLTYLIIFFNNYFWVD